MGEAGGEGYSYILGCSYLFLIILNSGIMHWDLDSIGTVSMDSNESCIAKKET